MVNIPTSHKCSVRITDCSSRIVFHVDNQLSPSLLSQTLIYIYMWQSRVEIEHYSVAYFDRVAAFKAL